MSFLADLKRAMEGDIPFGASGTTRFDLPFPEGNHGQRFAEPFHDEDGAVTGADDGLDDDLGVYEASGVKTASVPTSEDQWDELEPDRGYHTWEYFDAYYSYEITEAERDLGQTQSDWFLWTIWENGHSVKAGEAGSFAECAQAINAWYPAAQNQMSFANVSASKVRGGVRIALVNPAPKQWIWAIANIEGEGEDGVAESEEEAEGQYVEAIRSMARRAYKTTRQVVSERMPHLIESEQKALARKMAVTYPGVFSAKAPAKKRENRWGFKRVEQ